MQFRNKNYNSPDIGDYVIKRKFAFLPRIIKDKIVWLEHYESIFVFAQQTIGIDGQSTIKYKQWILIDTRCTKR